MMVMAAHANPLPCVCDKEVTLFGLQHNHRSSQEEEKKQHQQQEGKVKAFNDATINIMCVPLS